MPKSKNSWVPEICYEEEADGLSSHIPFIQVPRSEEMPSILYIFESRETGEFEPGLEGNPVPVIELDLHQYADLSVLKQNLNYETYDVVRSALGLEPLKSAAEKGEKITSSIRQKVEISS